MNNGFHPFYSLLNGIYVTGISIRQNRLAKIESSFQLDFARFLRRIDLGSLISILLSFESIKDVGYVS